MEKASYVVCTFIMFVLHNVSDSSFLVGIFSSTF